MSKRQDDITKLDSELAKKINLIKRYDAVGNFYKARKHAKQIKTSHLSPLEIKVVDGVLRATSLDNMALLAGSLIVTATIVIAFVVRY